MRLTFLLFCFLPCVGCGCGYGDGAKEYSEVTKIPREKKSERVQKFSNLSTAKQIDVYLYARNCPDDPNIGPLLYENGEQKIQEIVQKIKSTEAIWDKGYLVQVLYNINEKCRCIDKNSETVKELEKEEAAINSNMNIPKDYEYKQIYSDNLKFLKSQLK